MAHSDDEGLILPPKIAPLQVVIVHIYKGEEQKALIDAKADEILANLKAMGIRAKYDDNDNAGRGLKFEAYVMHGVPARLAPSVRHLEKNVVEIARPHTKEKLPVGLDGITHNIYGMLLNI